MTCGQVSRVETSKTRRSSIIGKSLPLWRAVKRLFAALGGDVFLVVFWSTWTVMSFCWVVWEMDGKIYSMMWKARNGLLDGWKCSSMGGVVFSCLSAGKCNEWCNLLGTNALLDYLLLFRPNWFFGWIVFSSELWYKLCWFYLTNVSSYLRISFEKFPTLNFSNFLIFFQIATLGLYRKQGNFATSICVFPF